MENKLKPCPFCGGKAKIGKGDNYYATCENEQCYGYQMTDGEFGYANLEFATHEQAIEAWNRRSSDAK